ALRQPDGRLPLEREQSPERGDEDAHRDGHDLPAAHLHRRRLRHELREHAGAALALRLLRRLGRDALDRRRARHVVLAARLARARRGGPDRGRGRRPYPPFPSRSPPRSPPLPVHPIIPSPSPPTPPAPVRSAPAPSPPPGAPRPPPLPED